MKSVPRKKNVFVFFVLTFFIFIQNAVAANGEPDTYFFHVDSPHMVDIYWNIFNAIVALFKNENYFMAMKLIFLIGGVITFFMGVIRTGEDGSHRGLFGFAKYLIGGSLILVAMGFSSSIDSDGNHKIGHPKKLVIISDTLGTYCNETISPENSSHIAENSAHSYAPSPGAPTQGAVVGNVPTVMAWGFSFFNQIGRSMTDLARTAFGSTDGNGNPILYKTSFSDYGAYLQNIKNLLSISLGDIEANTQGQTLFASSATSHISMSSLAKVIWNQCVFIPAGSDPENGPKIISAFSSTGDLKRTLKDYKNGRLATYKHPFSPDSGITDESSVIVDSGLKVNGIEPSQLMASVYGATYRCGALIDDFLIAVNNIQDKNIFCVPELRHLDKKTMAILTGSVFSSAQVPKAYAKQIVVQAGLANQVYDAKRNIALGEIPYATGKSMAEFSLSSLGTGYYMAKVIPYIQAGLRAILYAFFPFVFLVTLLPGGLKVMFNYLQSMLWIELWAPTAAILDMFLSFMSSEPFKAMFQDSGMNYLNSVQAFSDASMMASVAGYLYASLPALTWLILKGSGFMLGNITASVGAVMTKNMDSNVVDMDRSTVEAVSRTNRENKLRGINEIGIAELNKGLSIAAGSAIGGRYLAYEEAGKDNIAKSAEGEVLNQVSDGVGVNKAFHKDGDVKKAIEQKSTNTEFQTRKEIGAGQILDKMNEKEREKLAEDVATGNIAKDSAEAKTVEKLSKYFGISTDTAEGRKDLANRIAEANSFDKTANIVNKDHQSKIISPENKGKIDSSKELMALMMAKGELNSIAKTMGLKGEVIDKDGNINQENLNKVLETVQTSGKYKGAEIAAIAEVINATGAKNIKDAKLQEEIGKIGVGLSKAESLRKTLKGIMDADPSKRRVLNKIYEGLGSKNANVRNDAILAASAAASIIGAKGEGLNKVLGDKQVEAMKRFGLNAEDLSNLKMAVSKEQWEAVNALADAAAEDSSIRNKTDKFMSEHGMGGAVEEKSGRALSAEERRSLEKDLKRIDPDINLSEITNTKLEEMKNSGKRVLRERAEKIEAVFKSHGVRAKEMKDLSPVEKIKVSQSVFGTMKGGTQEWKDAAEYYKVLRMGKAATAKDFGLAAGAQLQIDTTVMRGINSLLNSADFSEKTKAEIFEVYGVIKGGLRIAGSGASGLANIARSSSLFRKKAQAVFNIDLSKINNQEAKAVLSGLKKELGKYLSKKP